jgi:hypothetical protein
MVPVTLLDENQKNNQKVLMGKIVELKKQIFYEVDFGDGTFSTDMIPEDIIVISFLFFFKSLMKNYLKPIFYFKRDTI